MDKNRLDEILAEAGETTSEIIGKDYMSVIDDKTEILSQIRQRLPQQLRNFQTLFLLLDSLAQAVGNDRMKHIKEFHTYIKDSFDYNETDYSINFKGSLREFFYLRQFEENEYRKYVCALFLDTYLQAVNNEITEVDSDAFLDLHLEHGLKAQYFSKDYIVGELRNITREIIEIYKSPLSP